MQAVWADTIVEDANLTVAISHLRKALGRQRNRDEFIQTIPRVGYRFAAEVREIGPEPDNSALTFGNGASAAGENGAAAVPPGAEPAVSPRAFHWQKVAIRTLLGITLAGLLSDLFIAGRTKPSNEGAEIKTMAVLPFRTLGPKPDDDYLGLGLADALITRLGRMHELTIRPISAVQKFTENLGRTRSPSDASWVWKQCSTAASSRRARSCESLLACSG